jgi:hypothetical protein
MPHHPQRLSRQVVSAAVGESGPQVWRVLGQPLVLAAELLRAVLALPAEPANWLPEA